MSMMAQYCRIPTNYGLPSMIAEEVLRCPKCSDRLVPQLLDTNAKGEQNVWWVCAAMSEDPNSCNFPLAMPSDVYWVKRTPNDVRINVIPRPKVKKLPKKYHHLYPGIFSASGSSRGSHCSSLTKRRKALTRSDGVSAGSSESGHRPLTPLSNMHLEKSTTASELAIIGDVNPVDRGNTNAERSILSEVEVVDLPSTSTPIVTDERISSQPVEQSRCISPGIGDLFSTPQPGLRSQNAVETNHSRVTIAEKNTTDFQIAKNAENLEKNFRSKPGSVAKTLKRNINLRRTPTLAPAPFTIKVSTPWEKTKAVLTLMHSAPNEIPESFAQASRKLAVAAGYKQRISQWNRSSAIESWKDEHQVKPPTFFKRARSGADMLSRNIPHDMTVPKPEEGEMQNIEMEVHHKLTAKMMQHGYQGKYVDEINYLTRQEEYHLDYPSIPETVEPTIDQELQFESMQPVKEEEMHGHVDWFSEIDNMDLSTYGREQSTHWSTLTQASTSAPEVFSGAFEDPSNEDTFDDPFAWNGM